MSFKNFSIGMLVGSLAGGIYGLWTAPRSGKEQTERTKDYFERVQADGQSVGNDIQRLSDQFKDLQDNALPKVQIFQEEVKKTLENYKQESQSHKNAIESLNDDISTKVADLNSSVKEKN